MLKNILKKTAAFTLAAIIAGSFPACGKREAGPLVKNNEVDRLIAEANTPSSDKVSVDSLGEFEKKEYYKSFENSEGTIKININADYDIPDVDSLSVYSVKQAPFSQSFVDKVRAELMGEQAIYDGGAFNMDTKAAYDSKVKFYQEQIANTGSEVVRDEFQKLLDEILPAYNAAPDKIELSLYPSDGKLRSTKALYDEKSYYDWEYSMYPNGQYLHAVTDGNDGMASRLIVYNSPEDSNVLRLVSNKLFIETLSTGYNGHLDLETFEKHYGDVEKIRNEATTEKPENYTGYVYGKSDGTPLRYYHSPDENCTLPLEEAIAKADELLKNLGLDTFKCYESELSNDEIYGVKGTEIMVYRTNYELTYLRTLDGVFVTQSSGDKHNLSYESSGGNQFDTKRRWHGEKITIRVTDDGIVEFIYWSPLEIVEKAVSDAAVMDLEKIKEAFEKAMTAYNAHQGITYEYNINRVRLSYSRIAEGITNYESGLIVPMWDFYGDTAMDADRISYSYGHSIRAVNAIDGTVIIPSLGCY